MDDVRAVEADIGDLVPDVPGDHAIDAPPAIGGDERRMHVRAYNHWVSLLGGRAFPSIGDLDPAGIADFGPHSVLLDFTGGPEDPAVPFLGAALRREGGLAAAVERVADVPSGSLVSRLTDHYLQIIANRAPIGFEAEFVNRDGHNTLYRGILMPFSSGGDRIDFIYGVINWKVAADAGTTAALMAEVEDALTQSPAALPPTKVWADGPNAAPLAGSRDPSCGVADAGDDADASLADHLALARATADLVAHADARSRTALYRALGLAYDFALLAAARAEDYAELLDDAGLKAQARAPMTPVVKLVFGANYDKTRLTEFAAALSYAARSGMAPGTLAGVLEGREGGLKAIVAAERTARRPAPRPDPALAARTRLAAVPARATLAGAAFEVPPGEGYVLLLARLEVDGALGLLGTVDGDSTLLDRAVRRFAA